MALQGAIGGRVRYDRHGGPKTTNTCRSTDVGHWQPPTVAHLPTTVSKNSKFPLRILIHAYYLADQGAHVFKGKFVYTRPKPPHRRQGLAGYWAREIYFLWFFVTHTFRHWRGDPTVLLKGSNDFLLHTLFVTDRGIQLTFKMFRFEMWFRGPFSLPTFWLISFSPVDARVGGWYKGLSGQVLN